MHQSQVVCLHLPKFQHIEQNPMQNVTVPELLYLSRTSWDDFCYGFKIKNKYKNILFDFNVEWVNSKNYLWRDKHDVTNLFISLNSIYLW